jgi:hypothetical protein
MVKCKPDGVERRKVGWNEWATLKWSKWKVMPGEVTKVRCVGVRIAEARLMDQEAQKSFVTSSMTFEVKDAPTIAS